MPLSDTTDNPQVRYCKSTYKCFDSAPKGSRKAVLSLDYSYSFCENCRKKARSYYHKPSVKQKIKEYTSRSEVKERKKEYPSRPEVKEKKKEYDKKYKKEYRSRPKVKEREMKKRRII